MVVCGCVWFVDGSSNNQPLMCEMEVCPAGQYLPTVRVPGVTCLKCAAGTYLLE